MMYLLHEDIAFQILSISFEVRLKDSSDEQNQIRFRMPCEHLKGCFHIGLDKNDKHTD